MDRMALQFQRSREAELTYSYPEHFDLVPERSSRELPRESASHQHDKHLKF